MITETMKLLLTYTVAVMLSGEALGAGFQNTSAPPPDLSTLSLEDLTLVDVSSVARKTQELFKTPAAVFVITREDIRASGANTLPELFRMVPGVQVAQASANTSAVSAHGASSVSDDVGTIGGYALGRWEHRFAGSDLAVQTFESVKLTGGIDNLLQSSIPRMLILFVHRFLEAPLSKLSGASKHTL